MKRTIGAVERLFPMPCPLVVGGTLENADALAVAWINVVASTPPTVAMGLRESRHTLELVRASRSFTVNIPTASMAPVVDYFGMVSGRTVDKFAATGLRLHASSHVPAPIIAQCPYNLECRVTQEHEVGHYVVVFGEIVEVHADEAILRDGDQVDAAVLDPLVYIAGAREYWRLGEKVADAFSVWKTIAPDDRDGR